jgi:hypothetical protein
MLPPRSVSIVVYTWKALVDKTGFGAADPFYEGP